MSIYINVLVILLLTKYVINQWPNITSEKAQKAFLVISSIGLAFFTGLRDKYTGADTIGYGNNFLDFRRLSFSFAVSDKTGRMETGYKIWVKVIGYITDNVNVFFTVTALFIAFCVAYCIYKNSKNMFMSMILYYTVGMFTFQLTGFRQAIAMGILLLSIEFIKEKKLLKFVLVVWIASLFHKSALCFLVAYLIGNMKMNFKTFILYVIGTVFVLVYNSWVINFFKSVLGVEDRYEMGGAVNDQMGGFAVIGMIGLTLILCYIFSEKLNLQSKYNKVFFNITVFAFVIYLLRYVIRIIERVSFYYQFAFIILLPNVIEAIPDNKTRKTVYVCAMVLACLLFFYRYQIKPNYYGFLWK